MKPTKKHACLLELESLNHDGSLIAFTTTIHQGVSSGSYTSFNLGFQTNDDRANVVENRKRLKTLLGTSALIVPNQNHGDKIAIIDTQFLSSDLDHQDALLAGVDALITQQPNVCIGVTTADCVPVVIHDPLNKVVATVHAGWRGTVARLAQKTVAVMVHQFGSRAKDLLVAIGPCICASHYEVGDQVVCDLRNANYCIEDIAYVEPTSNKYHIDLPLANKLSLVELGIVDDHIQVLPMCTYSDVDYFFSARRQGIHSGRMLTGAMLKTTHNSTQNKGQ